MFVELIDSCNPGNPSVLKFKTYHDSLVRRRVLWSLSSSTLYHLSKWKPSFLYGHNAGLATLVIPISKVNLTIRQDFRFHNGNDALALANGRVAGEDIRVLHDGLVGRRVAANLQHTTPLGEVAAILLVLGATLGQVIQAWWQRILAINWSKKKVRPISDNFYAIAIINLIFTEN